MQKKAVAQKSILNTFRRHLLDFINGFLILKPSLCVLLQKKSFKVTLFRFQSIHKKQKEGLHF